MGRRKIRIERIQDDKTRQVRRARCDSLAWACDGAGDSLRSSQLAFATITEPARRLFDSADHIQQAESGPAQESYGAVCAL